MRVVRLAYFENLFVQVLDVLGEFVYIGLYATLHSP